MSLNPAAMQKLEKFKKETEYTVVCDTCGEIFAEMSAGEYMAAQARGIIKNKWYFKAAYHWIDNQDHEVNVYLVMPRGLKEIVFQLSQDWRQKLQYEPDQSIEAMKNELKHLESGLIE